MANEITVSMKLSVVKGFLDHVENPGTQSFDMSGLNASGGVQSIPTAGTLLAFGSVGTPGFAYFRNTGPTNFVEIGTGTTTFVSFAKLKAGQSMICPLSTNAPSARANTAAINLQYYIVSD